MYGHCTKKIEVVRSRGRITGKHLRFWGRQTARVPTVSRDAANTLYGLVGICHCEKSLLHTSGPTITTTSRHLFEFERFFFFIPILPDNIRIVATYFDTVLSPLSLYIIVLAEYALYTHVDVRYIVITLYRSGLA